MRALIKFVFAAATCCLLSCSGSDQEMTPLGDYAEINMRNQSTYSGELLFIDDSTVYVMLLDKIYAISGSSIEKIIIDKYNDRSWLVGVILFEFVPSIVISSIAASMTDESFALIFGITVIPSIVSAILFEVSTPPGEIENTKSKQLKYDFRKYSRYPGGMTCTQLRELLKSYGQDSCVYVK